ncbi:Armadillo repeat-containing protein 8 [Homalodisca vitripennis]|nr:Armadillo repeat-containing protein 8 [Homalodisca vitripennis]
MLQAFASLGANDEDIRKKIIETDSLMEHIVTGLQDPCPKVRLAAVRCLHSLSRSVQQLRTTFQDHSVWKPLMALLQNASDDILSVASSTLCNLLLEFSPSKEPILESGAVDLLCNLTKRPDPALRLNGIWALMILLDNEWMGFFFFYGGAYCHALKPQGPFTHPQFHKPPKTTYQVLLGKFTTLVQTTKDGIPLSCCCRTIKEQVFSSFLMLITHSTEWILPKDANSVKMLPQNMAFQAEQKIKSQILNTLGTDQIFRLLSDPQVNVLMKTLGLLRNLLSTKPHIDYIMGLHGNQIMQAVILILEGNHSAEVKEQALCILANIADGDSAKDYIMSNEDVLKKLQDYMVFINGLFRDPRGWRRTLSRPDIRSGRVYVGGLSGGFNQRAL